MIFVPPWLNSGAALNPLLEHEYLVVSSGRLDVWLMYLGIAVLAVAAARLLRIGKFIPGGLTAIACLVFCFMSALAGLKLQSYTSRVVVKPSPMDVMAEIAGCTRGWLPERDTPNGCGSEGHKFSPKAWEQWFDMAEKVAGVMKARGCSYVSSGIESIVACAQDIPPTSIRQLLNYHNLNAPSRRCQTTLVLQSTRITPVIFALKDGGYARTYREKSVACDVESGKTTYSVDVQDLWREDLREMEHRVADDGRRRAK